MKIFHSFLEADMTKCQFTTQLQLDAHGANLLHMEIEEIENLHIQHLDFVE